MSPAESWLVGPSSTRFFTRTYTPESEPPKAVIVFVHGFAEHSGRYTHFHPLLVAHGFAIFAFDQRGFGRTALDPVQSSEDAESGRSKSSSYGKTSWADQMRDIAWAVGVAKEKFPDTPVFLMGHSMGGGEALGFPTQGDKSTSPALSGVIATSPLIHQTKPASKLLRWIGGIVSLLAPYALIPAGVVPADLSHDAKVGDAYMKDPLVKQSGSLRGIHDMLTQAEALLETHFTKWPENLPLLLIHGTEDKIASHPATQAFYIKVSAKSKKFASFPDGYHELQNESHGIQEKLVDEIVAFVEAHLPEGGTQGVRLVTKDSGAPERAKM
ncbi:Alpha/Beta hydrolase protein [Infundibulicybe gibba]|nr:Alpha/Beta hydrolase protein [Infundibulicybe gibba]